MGCAPGRRFVAVAVVLVSAACGGSGAAPTPPSSGESGPVGTEPTFPWSTVTTTSFPPIYGYGDFSAYGYDQVPWDEVTALELACLRDHGVSVAPVGATGIRHTGPIEQAPLFEAYSDACHAGLNVPDESTLTSAGIETVYDFWLDQAECLRELGYAVPDAPSRETFVENYPEVDWVPYRWVPIDELAEAEESCPQSPWD